MLSGSKYLEVTVGDGRVLVVHVSNSFAHFSKNLEYLRLRYRLSLLALSVQCLHQVFSYNKAMPKERERSGADQRAASYKKRQRCGQEVGDNRTGTVLNQDVDLVRCRLEGLLRVSADDGRVDKRYNVLVRELPLCQRECTHTAPYEA